MPEIAGDARSYAAELITHGPCRVIAEAGANHNNSVDRAIEMARRAEEAGAWAQVQLYKADTISVPASPKYWTDDWHRQAVRGIRALRQARLPRVRRHRRRLRELGIVFFATPFDLAAVDALEGWVPLYKIASADITHSRCWRPWPPPASRLLSTGAATVEEVHQAIEWMGLGPDKLVLLVCTLTYPTPDEDANFARIPAFARASRPT